MQLVDEGPVVPPSVHLPQSVHQPQLSDAAQDWHVINQEQAPVLPVPWIEEGTMGAMKEPPPVAEEEEEEEEEEAAPVGANSVRRWAPVAEVNSDVSMKRIIVEVNSGEKCLASFRFSQDFNRNMPPSMFSDQFIKKCIAGNPP